MKIVHLCLACFFPDNYSYQENLLPKYHKAMGYDVEVIASLQSFDENGEVCYLDYDNYKKSYFNENDIKVTRLDYKKPIKVYRKMKRFKGLEEALECSKPDILFIHGCQFLDVSVVVKFLKKNPLINVYVDNHADFSNSATNKLSLVILHKMIWKRCAYRLLPYTKRFYGVLPARVDFLKRVYKIPTEKVELLVMGAEDEKVNSAMNSEVKASMRQRYNIGKDDFLIVFGGKIDLAKQQVLLLMQAVNKINKHNLKLLIFGSVVPNMIEKIQENCSEKVQYIGWVPSCETYNYFGMADLVCFPGRHSVFWEQVAGMGIPMLVKRWNGTMHIDLGGNVQFIGEDSVDEIVKKINQICDKDIYGQMKIAALRCRKEFLYSNIAKKSLEDYYR